MSEKVTFGSKIGLIASTVGSAVGLGRVWRFPAETQANGGAAFLVIYIICVFLFGIPVMTAEFSLGRGGGSDAVGAFRNVTPGRRHWWLVGALAILASYLILSFYMVVSGWTLEYLVQSVTGDLYSPVPETVGLPAAEAGEVQFSTRMGEYITGSVRPIVMTYVMLAANLGVLMMGVQKGIEKMSNIMMPLLFVLLVVFCAVSLSLPKAAEGVEFFLEPDFSAISAGTVVNALGQAFFSLSLAMGILVTYSSYYPKDTKLTRTAVTVSLLDLGVAILMGLIIFPAVMTFGLADHNLAGSALVFITLPEIFAQMGSTQVWSALFFLLLLVAALTSTISIAEVSVAMLRDRLNMRRTTAVIAVTVPLMLFSAVCSLSFSVPDTLQLFGQTVFNFLDTVTTNVFIPLVSIAVCVYMGWFAPKGLLRRQLSNDGRLHSPFYPVVLFVIRYVAPVLIALVMIFNYL